MLEVLPTYDTTGKVGLRGTVETQLDSRRSLRAEKGTNNTREPDGMGVGLLWVRDMDDTDSGAMFIYDSMYATNMVQGL